MVPNTNLTLPKPEQGGVVQPMHREHLGELIRQARADGVSIGSGGATYRWDLSRLDEVIQFHPPDMVLSVEGGTSFHAVKDLVETERLWLPLDSPQNNSPCIADFLAEDASLSWISHHYGTARDWVMKVSVGEDHGRIVTSGAALVKNVAGYQLAPLYIGARHALGPIVDASFRLLPLPTRLQFVQWAGIDLTTVKLMLGKPLGGTSCSARRNPWEGIRFIHGKGEFRMDAITRISQDKIMAWAHSIGAGTLPVISEVDKPPREHELDLIQPMLRIQILPSQVGQVLAELPVQVPELICYPAAGVLHLGNLDWQKDIPPMEAFLSAIVEQGGRINAFHNADSDLLPAAREMTHDQMMLQRIKSILDPMGVFGPMPEYSW